MATHSQSNRFLHWLSLFYGLLLCLPGAMAFTAHADSQTVAEPLQIAVFEYPPFLSQNVRDYGLEPALVTAAFAKMQVQVEYRFLPAARALIMAGRGDYDATLGWVHSQERETDFIYSNALVQAPLVFFHLKNQAFDWQRYEDLQHLRIGTVTKYYYGPEFEQALRAGKLQAENSAWNDELNFRKLIAHHINLTPVNLYVGYNIIQNSFDAQTAALFTHHEQPLKISVHHLLFPKKSHASSRRAEVFNQGLEKLRQSGEYERIIESFQLKPERLISIAGK